jgi:hypothetical protein
MAGHAIGPVAVLVFGAASARSQVATFLPLGLNGGPTWPASRSTFASGVSADGLV